MYLVVNELESSLTVDVVFDGTNSEVHAIRPYLYVHNSPAGSLKVSLMDSAGTTTIASKEMTIAALIAGLNSFSNYYHGYVLFELDNTAFIADGNYKIKLEGTNGYSFDEADYIGWISEHEDRKNDMNFTPAGDDENSFSYEVWSYKEV